MSYSHINIYDEIERHVFGLAVCSFNFFFFRCCCCSNTFYIFAHTTSFSVTEFLKHKIQKKKIVFDFNKDYKFIISLCGVVYNFKCRLVVQTLKTTTTVTSRQMHVDGICAHINHFKIENVVDVFFFYFIYRNININDDLKLFIFL